MKRRHGFFRKIFIFVIILIPGMLPGEESSGIVFKKANEFRLKKNYTMELKYLKKAAALKPDSHYIKGRIAQNIYVYQKKFIEAIPWYEASYPKGKRPAWILRQAAGAYLWAGHYYFGLGKWKRAEKYFRKAAEAAEEGNFPHEKYVFFAAACRTRRAMGRIKPDYIHKIQIVFVKKTDVRLVDGVKMHIRGALTERQKKRALIGARSMKSLWEVMSGGKLSAEIRVLEWNGAIKKLRVEETGAAGKKRRWRLEEKSLCADLSPVLIKTIGDTDTYCFIWSSREFNIANAGSWTYYLEKGKKVHRGFVQIPSERLLINAPFLFIHEFFHVLENTGGIRPRHGFSEKNKRLFPGYKGSHELEYYQWHFRTTFPKLKKGWKGVSFIR